MAELNFKQLIDLAIGSPEPGHVNFYALHCLLYSIVEKLNILEETVDCEKYGNISMIVNSGKSLSELYLHKKFEEITKETACSRMAGNRQDLRKKFAEIKKSPSCSTCMPSNRFSSRQDLLHKRFEEITKEIPSSRMTGGAEPTDEAEEVKEADAEAPSAEAEAAPAEVEPTEEIAAPESAPAAAAPEEPPAEPTPTPPSPPPPTPPTPEEPPIVPPAPPAEAAQPAEVPSAPFSVAAMDTTQLKNTIDRIESRLMRVEAESSADKYDVELQKGISIMKDQLELAMRQLHLLTTVMVSHKTTDPQKLGQLNALTHKLHSIRKENIYIRSTHRLKLLQERSMSMGGSEQSEEDVGDEELGEETESRTSRRSGDIGAHIQIEQTAQDQYELDAHLGYPPEKVLDQLLELKSEFCALTNKVNDISATILEQDCQHTVKILNELQDQMRDVRLNTTNLREEMERLELKQKNNNETFEEIKETLKDLMSEKIDKSEIAILLADKVDFNQLQRKVSHEQLKEMNCRMDKQFCEMHKLLNINERNMIGVIENRLARLGFESIDEILKKFKEKIEQEILAVQAALDKYIASTNDDCAAAGARIKVLQDLACLSCDTTCVMRTIEKARVPKLPNAHATNLLSPIITYELGSIRKSGIMGYYRKDDFPHAPNAWLKGQQAPMKACVPRHAGGVHTTHTAKEKVEKVFLQKK